MIHVIITSESTGAIELGWILLDAKSCEKLHRESALVGDLTIRLPIRDPLRAAFEVSGRPKLLGGDDWIGRGTEGEFSRLRPETEYCRRAQGENELLRAELNAVWNALRRADPSKRRQYSVLGRRLQEEKRTLSSGDRLNAPSRQGSFATSINSIYTTEFKLRPGQQRLNDDQRMNVFKTESCVV
ncbi:hypothetical protein G6011_08637 [Alternaria panax]|uniref:Uncharacterized protein n=1 Tax=Alternaria panax TaxID=48097 RepID=A0AAD4FMU4_9PLEO|nr:hypothetical protein G6011_08637 [Alternaria panax]